ncbi:MAG: hypothetical protein HY280_01985 [Nitrospinae bacterium]|nr:hypothetical protein [Nitrospinota bacterium]
MKISHKNILRGPVIAMFVVAAALSQTACQDHHFVPIEKADSLKLPGNDTGATGPGKTMETVTERQRQKEKPSAPAGPVQLLVNGTVELGPEQMKKDFAGYTLYVIAWPKELKGMPIAAARFSTPKFPISYRLDSNDLMSGDFPQPGAGLMIEARLDKNSDPSIKTPGDVVGATDAPIAVGSTGVKIVINRER